MRVARHADAPVPLEGDIDRGGVFAQFIGTMLLLNSYESALVKGLAVNKFRGDRRCSRRALTFYISTQRSRLTESYPTSSISTYPKRTLYSLALPSGVIGDDDVAVHIAVVRLPHIDHFDSFDHILNEPGVPVRFVSQASEFGEPDLIVILDSKTTVPDTQGLSERIFCARSDGTPMIGVCAGYRMLGTVLFDPDGVESPTPETRGLGLLPTIFLKEKAAHRATGRVTQGQGLLGACQGAEFTAYEIHMGLTSVQGLTSPLLVEWRSGHRANSLEGALASDGLTWGRT